MEQNPFLWYLFIQFVRKKILVKRIKSSPLIFQSKYLIKGDAQNEPYYLCFTFNKNRKNCSIFVNKVLNLIICNSTKLTATNYDTYLKKINK